MKKQEIYGELWATLDKARDLAQIIGDEEDIITLSQLRKKYLNLSGIADKVINQLNKKIKMKEKK